MRKVVADVIVKWCGVGEGVMKKYDSTALTLSWLLRSAAHTCEFVIRITDYKPAL
jgi:hypothetical protein